MISFSFAIMNLWPKNRPQVDYIEWDKKLSKNHAIEVQVSRWTMNDYFSLDVDLSWTGKDHAGPRVMIELFGFMFLFNIYDTRHWDYDNSRWEEYDNNK